VPDREDTEQFQAEHAALLVVLAEAVEDAWLGLGAWNDPDVARFVDLIDPIAVAVRAEMVDLVDGYLAQLSHLDPLGLSARLAALIAQPRGLPPADVWRRPFITQWQALSEGVPFLEANARGSVRAVTMSQHDTQIVMRAAVDEAVAVHADLPDEVFEIEPRTAPPVELRTVPPQAPETASIASETAPDGPDGAVRPDGPADDLRPRRLVGYRRVLTGRSCMFCAAAATKRYRKRDLMPLHARCDCSVAPIFPDSDPGDLLNEDLLRNLKERGPEYWKARGFVDNEGRPLDPTRVPAALGRAVDTDELGPVLTHT
jgi:hypothetical protein